MGNFFLFLAGLNFVCIILAFFEFGTTKSMTAIRFLIGFGTVIFLLGYVAAQKFG